MPSRHSREPTDSARGHAASPETVGAWLVFLVSAGLSVLLLSVYISYRDAAFQLTLQRPFTSWRDVRELYQGLSGQPVQTPPDNLTALVLSKAWCNYTTPRPWVVPANRSAACACLWAKQQAFVNNNTWGGGTYNQSVCYAAGDDAVGCLRFRSTWDVWGCGDDCRVHPVALAATSSLGLCALGLAALLASMQKSQGLVRGLTGVPLLGGVVLLLALRPVQNFLFAMVLLAVWAGIVVGLDGELSGPQPSWLQSSAEGRPLALMTCFWFVQPLLVASGASYLAIAHSVRDLAGLLCYATLGYLAGLFAQRVHWARCYLVFGADGGGWPLPSHFARAVQRLAVWGLGLGLVGVWTGLLVLAYTQWLGGGPFAAAGASLALVLLCAAVCGLELGAGLAGSEVGKLGWVEGTQIALALAGQIVFASTAMADAYK